MQPIHFCVALGIAAVTLVAVIVYFPNAPPSPPSLSHSVPKVAVARGILTLLSHGRFWIVTVALAVPLGVLSAWSEAYLSEELFCDKLKFCPIPRFPHSERARH